MVRIENILQHFIHHLTLFFTFQTKRKFKESNSREEERWEGRSHILFLVSPKTSPNCFFFLDRKTCQRCECYFEDRWQKDEMAGVQGRRRDGIKTVIKVEKCTFCDGRWKIESVWVIG